MTIMQVIYALEVEKCASFSEAASRLYISQPALSLQIRKLEEEVGVELFVRGSHGITATKAGRRFCDEARPAAAAWERLKRSIEFLPTEGWKHVKIGIGSRVFSNNLFDPVMAFFSERPQISVSFLTDLDEDPLRELEERRMDIALDRLPPAKLLKNPEDFFVSELLSERQCVMMSPDDPRSSLKEVSIQILEGSSMILSAENSPESRIIRQTCQSYGIKIGHVYRTDSIQTVVALVLRGKGLALGPASFAKRYGVAAVPLTPEVPAPLNLICLAQNRNNPLVMQLNAYLKKYIRSNKQPRF